MSDKPSGGVIETAGAPKRGCMSRLGAHCKRFWWLHVGIFIALVLVIVLPIIFVAYPKIAQREVNKSTLTIKEMKITDPTPEGFKIHLIQEIGSDSKYHPWLDAFDASISLDDDKNSKPFATFKVPKVKSKDGAVVEINQDVKLADVGAFTAYSKAVVKNKEVKLKVDGRTGLKQGSLPKKDVDYNKIVTMKGLDHLNGFNITKFDILPTKGDKPNMEGFVYIPNPSVMTLTMGNVTLSLSVAGKDIGTSNIDNLVLKPGNNTMPLTARVDQKTVLGYISGKNKKYKDGVVPIDIVGKSVKYNGKDIKYFAEALASNKITAKLDILGAM